MGNNGPKTAFNLLQLIGDIVLVNASIVIAFLIRFQGGLPQFNFHPYLIMIPFVSVLAVLLFNFYGLYHTLKQKWSEVLASLVVSIGILMLFTISISYMIQGFSFPRSVFFIAAIVQVITLGTWRWIMLKIEISRCPPRKIICVAPGEEADFLLEKLTGDHEIVIGIVTRNREDKPRGNFPHLGAFDEVKEICNRYRPDTVIVSGEVPDPVRESVVRGGLSRGWESLIIPSIYEIMLSQAALDQIDDIPVLKIDTINNPGRKQIKRLMDIAASCLGLVLFFPFFLLISLAIKIDSPGPVFYTQKRIGRKGRQFKIYKFRTMKHNAEASTGPIQSYKDDPRVTRMGRLLRPTRMDELPQLINVLKGDMSMVGPRPERPYFVERYEKEIQGYTYRHITNAGITGLAQVMSNYSTSIEDKLRYDLLYAKNYSPLFDIKIILQTIKVILMRDRAS
ncbi:MAG: sugar transferase [Firmicutes bacterium]|nr:sugar transferase [Bacillota bacterium]